MGAGPADPLSLSWLGQGLSVGQHDLAAADHEPGPALHRPAVIHRIAGPGLHAAPVDGDPLVRVPQREVGVGADGDRAFARIEAEQPGGVDRGQLHELVQRDAAGHDALGVQHGHQRFQIGDTLPGGHHVQGRVEFVGERPRRMVAADGVDLARGQPAPQRLPVGLIPQRRRTRVFGRVRLGETLLGQVQVQRPGLHVDRQSLGPSLLAPVQGSGRRQVHDVDRRAGLAGQADGLVDGLDLGTDRPRLGEMAHRAVPGTDQLLARSLEHRGVLAVHQRQRSGLTGRRHSAGQAGSPGRVLRNGQEHLQAGMPPPAKAASDPVQKSSTQIGSYSRIASPSAVCTR